MRGAGTAHDRRQQSSRAAGLLLPLGLVAGPQQPAHLPVDRRVEQGGPDATAIPGTYGRSLASDAKHLRRALLSRWPLDRLRVGLRQRAGSNLRCAATESRYPGIGVDSDRRGPWGRARLVAGWEPAVLSFQTGRLSLYLGSQAGAGQKAARRASTDSAPACGCIRIIFDEGDRVQSGSRARPAP